MVFSVSYNKCALGFWVLLSHQLLCDVDQAQQMLRPSFNAAMSAPLMYIFFICFCVPARLIRWLTINTYIHNTISNFQVTVKSPNFIHKKIHSFTGHCSTFPMFMQYLDSLLAFQSSRVDRPRKGGVRCVYVRPEWS